MRSLIATMLLAPLAIIGAAPAYGQASPSAGSTSAQEAHDALLVQLNVAQEQVDQRAQEHAKVRARLEELRNDIRSQTGWVGVTPEAVRQAVEKLQEQREQLALDEAAAQGRREGLEEAIAQYSQRAKERAQSDPVADQLQTVVAARADQLNLMQQQVHAGTTTPDGVIAAQVALAQARAELAAARQRAAGAGSIDALEAWNRELLNLSVDQREREARLKFIDKRLNQLSEAQGRLDDLTEALDQLRRSEDRLAQARDRVQALEERFKVESQTPPQRGK